MMVCVDGGDGWWIAVSGRKKDVVGTGNEITAPKNATFANHFEDSRGSKVSATAAQYLEKYEIRKIDGNRWLPCNELRARFHNFDSELLLSKVLVHLQKL